jgi:hypothetical protein
MGCRSGEGRHCASNYKNLVDTVDGICGDNFGVDKKIDEFTYDETTTALG